jgi:RNA polymerase sigma-70 factor, ECF subfamily
MDIRCLGAPARHGRFGHDPRSSPNHPKEIVETWIASRHSRPPLLRQPEERPSRALVPGSAAILKALYRKHNNVADPPAGEKAVRFERKVMPLREPLYLHALRMCHNHADAEDLLQDTMVKAYSNFDSFLPGSNFKAWLNRIQTNTYRRTRRRPVQCSTDTITDQELAAEAQRTSARHVSAEDQAVAALPDTQIMAGMQSLPERFRSVVYYADVEGFRYREIADIMGTHTEL